jgi:ribonuclease Z
LEAIQNVDLLYHEATFTDLHLTRAKTTYHSTARQAAQQAHAAQCKNLLLGHFSSRYDDATQHLLEAQEEFLNVAAAEDGLKIVLGKWMPTFGNADKKEGPLGQK